MLQRAAFALLLCLAGVAVAQTEASPSASIAPLPLVAIERQGYAFEYPRVLAQQRLFGIQHGVALLATACRGVATQTEPVAAAYAEWLQQQQDIITSVRTELSQFYFGARADEAENQHLVRALNLRESLAVAEGSPALEAACATLPQALSLPRYDLSKSFALDAALAQNNVAMRAELQAKKCPELLPESTEEIKSRFVGWQEQQGEQAELARQKVIDLWSATGRDGDASTWFNALKQRYANPSLKACKKLPTWLESPAANLNASFAAPSLPVNAEALLTQEDRKEETVAVTIPVQAPAAEEPPVVLAPQAELVPDQPASPPVPLLEDVLSPLQSLFDLLMKVFSHDPADQATKE